MGRIRFDDQNCGIARSLDLLGDWWTLLIIRDAFFGLRRFGDFQRHLGISRNVLTDRLRRLVENGIFARVDVGEHGERFEYRLTDKGEALLPVLTTLREWGDEWVFGEGNEPLVMRERASGERIPPTRVRGRDGHELTRREIRAEAGPGADATTRAVFGRAGSSLSPAGSSLSPAGSALSPAGSSLSPAGSAAADVDAAPSDRRRRS